MSKQAECPDSLEEAKDIAVFFQAFGYANACRSILKMVTDGDLDLGPKASGNIASQLAKAQAEASGLAELGTRFIDLWDATGETSKQTLHTLEDILGDVQ